jgi:hypothetical protein
LNLCYREKELRITLSADQAIEFSIDEAYDKTDLKPIIALFVGCLAKQYKGIYQQ